MEAARAQAERHKRNDNCLGPQICIRNMKQEDLLRPLQIASHRVASYKSYCIASPQQFPKTDCIASLRLAGNKQLIASHRIALPGKVDRIASHRLIPGHVFWKKNVRILGVFIFSYKRKIPDAKTLIFKILEGLAPARILKITFVDVGNVRRSLLYVRIICISNMFVYMFLKV